MWSFYGKHYNLAASCFGIAIAMKLFPFVFLGLFIARKQYRHTLLSLGFAGLTTIIGLWAICPDFQVAWHGISSGLEAFRIIYALHDPAFAFDHSLFRLLRTFFLINDSLKAATSSRTALSSVLNVYLAICALVGIALYFIRIRKLPFINQVLCLTVASILLPPISFDYTLLNLYSPLVLLIFIALNPQTGCIRQRVPGMTAALTLIAFLFAPETEFIWNGSTFEGQFKACCLAVLFIVGLRYPFKFQRDLERETDSA